MSSRKAATAKTVRRAKPAASAAVPRANDSQPAPRAVSALGSAAEQLAADIQRGLAAGDHDVLTPETLQTLMTAACRLYAAQSEAGSQTLPVGAVTPTDIMITASGLMRAGNLAVFELGMWQSWTGR
jgi:hypothetical protein